MRRLEIWPYQKEWALQFKEASEKLKGVLGDVLMDIQHIGSTSIPGMAAKPVIDILAEVRDIGEVDAFVSEMERAGFVPRGEHGIPGRRYFVRATENVHTHHVHVFGKGSEHVMRHLAFRDYLREYPDEAERYHNLKMQLVDDGVEDVKLYQDLKAPTVLELQESAEKWMDGRKGRTP